MGSSPLFSVKYWYFPISQPLPPGHVACLVSWREKKKALKGGSDRQSSVELGEITDAVGAFHIPLATPDVIYRQNEDPEFNLQVRVASVPEG